MSAAAPECPRCGYDQSGFVATWGPTGACPLDGVCSECGLAFRWRDLLHPAWCIPGWWFEHYVPWWRVGVHLRTCARAIRPWSFWSIVQLHWPIRAGRVARHAVAMLLACHVMFAASAAHQSGDSNPTWWLGRWTPPDRLEAVMSAADAFLWPYNPVSIFAGTTWAGRPLAFSEGAAWLAMWVLLTPLAFVFLAETFHRVRLRSAHVLRGFAYSLTPLPIWTLAWVLLNNEGLMSGLADDEAADSMARGLFFLAALWHVVGYWCFVRLYLRVPHAEPVVLALLTTAGLVAGFGVLLGYGLNIWSPI